MVFILTTKFIENIVNVLLRPAVVRSCTEPWQRLQVDHCVHISSDEFSSKYKYRLIIDYITDGFSQ